MFDLEKIPCGCSFHDNRGLSIAPAVAHETAAAETLSTPQEDLFQVCEGAQAKRNDGNGDGERQREGERDRVLEVKIPSRPACE
jgi:hypothetical protein